MIRSNLPELIVAGLMTLGLFVAYAVSGSIAGTPVKPPRAPVATVRPRFLLELRRPGQPPLRVATDGGLPGGRRLGETDLIDLRGYVERLRPDPASRGPWSLRFYDQVDRREIRFDGRHPAPEVGKLLNQLRLLQVL